MATLRRVGLALLLVAFVTGEEKCRTGCQGISPSVFQFAVGSTYKYDYEGKVDLSLSSAEGQHSTTKVKATVLLTQQAECNQVLRLQNLQIISADNKKYTNIEGIEKPVVLNFHDGHVEDLICTQPSDTQNSLNIKRAVASMFQAAQRHHGVDQRSEIDVFGNCPTEFSQIKEGPFQVIRKTRNLNKCSHRESLRQDFITTAFDPDSGIKSNPFLQGKYRAELKLKGGIPQEVVVNEDYLYVPFSNGEKGAIANVRSQLKFTGIVRDNPKVSCNVPRSIIFEDPHPILADKNCVGPILKALTTTANAIDKNVKENTASKFNNIRRLIKAAPKKDLTAVYNQVRAGAGFKNKDIGKKLFLDALFRAKTGDAIEVGIDIYKSNGLTKTESDIFFASLNFAEHVTEGALSASANLVASAKLPRHAYLGVGALARKYCRDHSCNNVKGLNALFTALQGKLNGNPSNKEAENVALAALKAIRNANHVNNPIVGKVIDIAQDKQAPIRLRVGALEAYLADPCNDRFRDSALSIMKDLQLDSELRIKAYLALVQCPNGKVATAIKNLIDKEPSIQVGGFIVSHLATLRSSTNPDKALAKAQLGEIRTTKKYPLDFRQYSFNGEYSYNIDTLGAAESVEGNLIFSQKSYIPRSLALNLTVELFSQRYNFLEVDIRQENLDELIASYFGPNGEFNAKEPDDFVKSGTQQYQKAAKQVGKVINAYKQKREVNRNQVESFAKQLTGKQNSLNKDLDLDFSIRLFGSELAFVSLNEGVQNYSSDALVDTIIEAIDDTQESVKNYEETFTSNFMFVDSEVSYPTSSGFPIRLSVEGTASSHVKTSAYVPEGQEFKLGLIPSISIELSSRFALDAAVVESGLTIVGNAYSSFGGEVEYKWTDNDFDVSFSLPLDKQELLTFTHDIVFETRELCGAETKVPLKFVQSKDFSVCLDQLKNYVGLTFCADLNQPNIGEASANVLPYPLNGNSKLSVTVLKNDFGRIRLHHEVLPGAIRGNLGLMDASNKLKSYIDYDLNIGTTSAVVKLVSPELTGSFEARLVNSPTASYGIVRLASNQIEYYVKIGMAYSGPEQRLVAKPILVYKAGQGDAQPLPYHATGEIIVEKSDETKYTFNNLKLVTPNGPPIGVAGYVTTAPGKVSCEIALDDGHSKGSLNGKLIIDEIINVNVVFNNNVNPTANFDLKYSLKFVDIANIDSKLQFIHGPDLSNKDAVLKLINNVRYKSGSEDNAEFETNHELTYPGLGIDDKLKLKTKKKSLDFELQGGYAKVKVGTKIEVELDKKSNGDLDFEFELYGFDNKLEIDLERIVLGGHRSKIHHKFAFNANSIDVSGDVKHFVEQHRVDLAQDLVIKITAKPDIKWKTALKYTQNDVDAAIRVDCGSAEVVDAFLKADSVGNVNGNLKLNIPDQLTANGEIKATKGTGKGSLLLNFVEVKRKLKTLAEFKVNEPTYNLDLTFYSNFEKDNSRKYRLLTNNQYKPESLLESKNTLEILGEKSVFNVKLSRKGDINDIEEAYETELILPNEQYFAGKLHRNVKNDKGAINGQGYLSLEQRPNKNAPGKTLTLKAVGKNVKPVDRTFDLTYTLGLDDGAGQTLNGELALKKSRNANDDSQIDYSGKLYGTTMSETLQVNIITNYNALKGDYKVSGSYGKGATVNVKGKYDINSLESKKPISLDIAVDVLTPNSVVRVIKCNFEGFLKVLDLEESKFDYAFDTALFVDDDGKEQGATIDISYRSLGQFSPSEGNFEDIVTIQKQDPYVILSKYVVDPDKQIMGDVTLKYTKDKSVRVFVDINSPNNETYNFDFQLETPIEKAKKVRLYGQITDSKDVFKSESTLTVDDLKYVEKITLDLNKDTPSYDFELIYPTGKKDKLYAKLLRMDENGFASESKVIFHVYDFTLDSKTDVIIHNYEDFAVKIYADCPKINVNKVDLVANTKEAGGSKKLQVNIKQGGKNILDGTTTYKLHKEGDKVIIDGSGVVTVNNQKNSGNFKLTYRELNQQRDKEKGDELTINAIVGAKAFDIEYIQTDKHFKYLTSYCIEKKECAHIEIETKEPDDYTEVLTVNLDLRPLGVSHEFGLKSENDLKKLKHSLDIHVVNNQHKYQYSELVLPTQSHFTLTTPKRIVSLETAVTTPKDKSPITGYVVLYLNKKLKPQEKTLLEYEVDTNQKLNFNAKLSAPPLKKPLSVSYKYQEEKKTDNYALEVELNILPNSNKKIIFKNSVSIDEKEKRATYSEKTLVDLQPLNYKLSENFKMATGYGTGDTFLNVDYSIISTYQNRPITTGYSYGISKDGGRYNVIVHNKDICDVVAKVSRPSNKQIIIDTDYDLIGCEKATSRLELKNGNTLKFEIFRKANKQKKLQINCGFIPGSIADFRMEVVAPNKKIDLVHGSVKLDESDFGKSDYGVNSNNIQEYLVAPTKQLSQEVVKASSDHFTKSLDEAKNEFKTVGNLAQSNKPDYTPIISYYEEAAKAVREEVITDESLKQFIESLDNIVAAVVKVAVDLINSFAKTTEKLIAALHKQSINIAETIEKDILPKAKEVILTITNKVISVFESVSQLCFGLLEEVTKFFDAHQTELKQINSALTKVTQDILQFLNKVKEQLEQATLKELNNISDTLKTLPVVDDVTNYVKNALSNEQPSEEAIATFKAHVQELKDKISFVKVKEFIDLTATYIEKKMRNQPCDTKEISDIIKAGIDAFDELFTMELTTDVFSVPVPSKIIDTLPEVIVSRLSLVNRIINGDIPTLEQLFETWATFNPEQLFLPFRKYAIVVQGQHIFTFDNKHLTFPGKCSYVLARDVVNNEFSIIGGYANGAFAEVTFIDKADTITIKKNGAITLNGSPKEFPVRGKKTVAERNYEYIQLQSDVGVNLYCTPDLTLCLFSVSGFYHGQLKGLLGNANAEPFDDYTTAKGTIVESEADFANSYKIQANCPQVPTVDHHTHHHADSCTKLFTELSELTLCQPFVNPRNFRQACDHGVAAGIPNTEASIARAYALACFSKFVPAFVPSQYLKCENSEKPYNLYETFSVKLPQKAADVVFAIDVNKDNEEIYKEFIQPLGNALTKDLADRGIKDVEFHVLTFGGAYPDSPSHVTTNQGKLVFKGKMPALTFSEPPDEDDVSFGHETLDFIYSMIDNYIKELLLALGFDPQSQAYLEAIDYPFRSNAVKAMVAVTSAPCQKSAVFGLDVLQKLRAAFVRHPSIQLNLITPLSKECSFKVKDDKTTKNVIGFNNKGVFTFSDAKKKPTGNPDLLKDLSYDDFCSEYTSGFGGNVFVLDNFTPKNKRLFTSVTSFNIAESLVSTEKGMDCICMRDGLFSAKNVCVAVHSKDKPPTTRKLQKG
ncbi:hypothetical protein Trydic_g2417 [Trypoxylus dichotomus]